MCIVQAYSAYGVEGVNRALQLLKDEMEMNMRLIGARTIEELTPEMVDTSALRMRSVGGSDDRLFAANYEGLRAREFAKPQPRSKL